MNIKTTPQNETTTHAKRITAISLFKKADMGNITNKRQSGTHLSKDVQEHSLPLPSIGLPKGLQLLEQFLP